MIVACLPRLLAQGLLVTTFLGATPALAQQPEKDSDWPVTTGDQGSRRYAPLDQIDKTNVSTLQPAWRWLSPDNELMKVPRFATVGMKPRAHESGPIKIGDRLFVVTGFGLAVAIDATTGKTLWMHDPKAYSYGRPTNHGFTHHGAVY